MGQEPSKQYLDNYAQNYITLTKVNQKPYGQGQLIQHIISKNKYIVITDYHPSPSFINNIKHYNLLSNRFLVQLINYYYEDPTYLGQSITPIKVIYEYCPTNLAEYIQIFNILQRLILMQKQKRILFNESQILYLLYSLTNYGNCLQAYNMSHKNIQPQNVLFNQDNHIKFLPTSITPFESDAREFNRVYSQHSYLPLNKNLTWNQIDMYASGLTLLDAMTLKFSYDIIECDNDFQRYNLIEERILSIKDKYSKAILLIVRKMLEPDTDITFEELHQYLMPFEYQIYSQEHIDLPLKQYQKEQKQIKYYQPTMRNQIKRIVSNPNLVSPRQLILKKNLTRNSVCRPNQTYFSPTHFQYENKEIQSSIFLAPTISPVQRRQSQHNLPGQQDKSVFRKKDMSSISHQPTSIKTEIKTFQHKEDKGIKHFDIYEDYAKKVKQSFYKIENPTPPVEKISCEDTDSEQNLNEISQMFLKTPK